MVKIKKIALSIFMLLFIVLTFGCDKPAEKKVSFKLVDEKIEIFVEESYEIAPTFENIENPNFEYKCESEVIKLEGNKITGLKAGTCVVVVTMKDVEDVASQSLEVIVKNIVPETIEVNEDNVSLFIGNTHTIEYSFKPENSFADVTFTSSDENIVKVNGEGVIRTINPGKTTVVVGLNNEGNTVTKEINVEVRGTDAPTITISEDVLKVKQIGYGSKINYLEGLTATDIEDGDITNKIEVVNEIDTTEYGVQTIEYRVVDRDDNEATIRREVEIVWNYSVQFIGHAGSYFGIMNSEEAILYAVQELKYQAVEVDLKQSKDGVFILCHDDTFAGKTLASTNWSDLKDLTETKTRTAGYPSQYAPLPNGGSYTSKLCTLERYLEICKEYNVKAVIELKSSNGITNSNQSRMQALMDEIEKADMLDNVIFLGSQYNCLIWTRNNGYADIQCQYLVNSCESETTLQRCIDYNFDVSINTTGDNISNSDAWLARYKEAGIKISTYTYTQYVDYNVVQQWIDKGVDYVTCDWHRMENLKLPVSTAEPKEQVSVKFVDHDGTVLKERKIDKGSYAAAPKDPVRDGYDFTGWDNELSNVQVDTVFTAQYEATKYSITYFTNLDVVTEGAWATKDDFVKEFYSDLFNWIKSKGTTLEGLTINGSEYSFTRNSTTVKFSSADDIKKLNVYSFEKTISNILYKEVERNSDGTCTIVEDNNFFLNSSEYRIKYQGMDQWLYNCIKTSYTSYNTTYKILSSGKIQIFFRMHQWMNGTKIAAFDNYPVKYIVESDKTVNAVLPTTPVSYTILDEVVLPEATGNVKFLGWYLTPDCSGEKVEKIEEGTTGNIVLYAKWDK